MLGDIRRSLGIGHHRDPDLVLDQGVTNFGPVREHLIDQVGRFAQGIVRHLRRAHDRAGRGALTYLV